MELSNVLFFDIETVSQYPVYSDLDTRWQLLFERKIRYFQEKEPSKSLDELYRERAAIFAEFGKIICIGLGYFHKEELRIKTLMGGEEEMLTEFFSIVNQFFCNPEKHIFCGHNIREFDVPYICRRACVHGLQLPAILNLSNKKPWEVKFIADTMELWKFGDLKNYISLDLLSACLGLDGSKADMDGSQVGRVYHEEKDLNRIAEYCSRDVWVTCNVFLRMHLLPAIDLEDVHFAELK